MLKVEFSNEANEEYIQIGKYIAQDNIYYSIEVLNKIDSSIDTICNFPLIGKNIGKGIQSIVEPKYRYKIVYTIKKDYIYIYSIFKYKNLWE